MQRKTAVRKVGDGFFVIWPNISSKGSADETVEDSGEETSKGDDHVSPLTTQC